MQIVERKLSYITVQHLQNSYSRMCILALDKVSLKSEDILTTANYFATRTIQTVPRSPDIVEGC